MVCICGGVRVSGSPKWRDCRASTLTSKSPGEPSSDGQFVVKANLAVNALRAITSPRSSSRSPTPDSRAAPRRDSRPVPPRLRRR